MQLYAPSVPKVKIMFYILLGIACFSSDSLLSLTEFDFLSLLASSALALANYFLAVHA